MHKRVRIKPVIFLHRLGGWGYIHPINNVHGHTRWMWQARVMVAIRTGCLDPHVL